MPNAKQLSCVFVDIIWFWLCIWTMWLEYCLHQDNFRGYQGGCYQSSYKTELSHDGNGTNYSTGIRKKNISPHYPPPADTLLTWGILRPSQLTGVRASVVNQCRVNCCLCIGRSHEWTQLSWTNWCSGSKPISALGYCFFAADTMLHDVHCTVGVLYISISILWMQSKSLDKINLFLTHISSVNK